MGNAMSLCRCRKHRVGYAKEITLLMVGLDNAGKTCVVKHLLGEPTSDAVPTVGFTSVQLKHEKYNICIYDVGGGPSIRDIWKNYYALVHGVIFVVDSSVTERFEECKTVIRKVIKDERIAGKPILLYFNKQDVEGAVDETELVSQLELEALVNEQHCPTRVESTCAIYTEQKEKDPGLWEGFSWMIGHIGKEFQTLQERVHREKSEQMKLEEEERIQRMERVQRIREERLRLQKEEEEKVSDQKSNGCAVIGLQDDDDDDNDVIIENPFKPVNVIKHELEQKEMQKNQLALRQLGDKSVSASSKECSKEQEIILQPRTVSSTSEFYHSQSPHITDGEVPFSSHIPFSSPAKGDGGGKAPQQKKKRFKNRIVPQVPECLSVIQATGVDLPPLKTSGDVPNGKLASYNSPKRQHLFNGQVNPAVHGTLPPSSGIESPFKRK